MEDFKEGLLKAIRTAVDYYMDDYRFFSDDFFPDEAGDRDVDETTREGQ